MAQVQVTLPISRPCSKLVAVPPSQSVTAAEQPEQGFVQAVARQKEPLCRACICEHVLLKIKSVVRLKHLIEPGDKVLAAFSGGMSPGIVRICSYAAFKTQVSLSRAHPKHSKLRYAHQACCWQTAALQDKMTHVYAACKPKQTANKSAMPHLIA